MLKKLGLTAALMAMSYTPVVAQDMDETLSRFKETGQITIGHRESSSPFSYVDSKGTPVGFSLDLCREIVNQIGENLGVLEPEINFVPVTTQNRIILVQNGTVDLECGSTSNTAERQKQVAFSYSFFTVALRMMTLAGSGIENFMDMTGKTFVIPSGSTADEAVKTFAENSGFIPNINYANENATALLFVQSARADAFVSDDILLAGLIANTSDPSAFEIVGETLGEDPYGLMMRREDTAFLTQVDSILKGMMTNGTYETLYSKWFLSPVPPRDIKLGYEMSPAVKALIANASNQNN